MLSRFMSPTGPFGITSSTAMAAQVCCSVCRGVPQDTVRKMLPRSAPHLHAHDVQTEGRRVLSHKHRQWRFHGRVHAVALSCTIAVHLI